MKTFAPLLALVLAGCNAPSSPAGPVHPTAPAARTAGKPGAGGWLPTREVVVEPDWVFVSGGLTILVSPRLPDVELTKRLPPPLRGHYAAAYQARLKLAQALTASGQQDATAATARGAARARADLPTAVERAKSALEASFARKPTVEIALAVSRLRDSRSLEPFVSELPQIDVGYGADAITQSDNDRVIEPLEKVLPGSKLDETGRWLRIELADHLLESRRPQQALPVLEELSRASSADQRPAILFRLALVEGLLGRDAQAADHFRAAHAGLIAKHGLSLYSLLAGELMARTRALQFERVLDLAEETWVEHAADRHEVGPDIFDMVELSTDAVERLGVDVTTRTKVPALRAEMASRLAVRAVYRGDERGGAAFGELARRHGGQPSRLGLIALRVLAARAGDTGQMRTLSKEIEPLSSNPLRFPRHTPDYDGVIGEYARDVAPEFFEDLPAGERAVQSLFRLCLEPSHHRLPQTEIRLRASVHSDGRVEVGTETLPATPEPQVLLEVTQCLKQLGPRVLQGADSSIDARVSLSR